MENSDAPRMKDEKIAIIPKKTTRGILLMTLYGGILKIFFIIKKPKGKSKTEPAEEALLYIIKKYNK